MVLTPTTPTIPRRADSAHDRRTAVIVGAGPAGLAAAAALGRAGARAIVLEGEDGIAPTWRRAYDRLRLNSSRLTSRLGGVPYPRGSALFPTRDDFLAYLERFAAESHVDVRLGTRVTRIDRAAGLWQLSTSAGQFRTEHVVVATGYANEPIIPAWPGRGRYAGTVLHSSTYRNPRPFRDRRILVAGAGSSGLDIAHDLATGGARRVWLSVRTPPTVLLRTVAGVPGDPVAVALNRLPAAVADAAMRVVTRLAPGDLSRHGLARPAEGPFAHLRRTGAAPAVVDAEVVASIRTGKIEVVDAIESLDERAVTLSGGRRIEPDAIVAATGYRCGLEPLVGHLGVLDARGIPVRTGGAPAAPGLWFVGFDPAPGQIPRAGREAAVVARQVSAAPEPTSGR